MIWLFELAFGKWEGVLVKDFGEIVVVCKRHSITKRERGFAIYPGGHRIELDPEIASEHIKKYAEPSI